MVKTREQRNHDIVQLRDQKRMKFYLIAGKYDITTSRAHQIYWDEKKRVSRRANKVRVGLSDVAKAFGTTTDKLELVIPQQSVIIKT